MFIRYKSGLSVAAIKLMREISLMVRRIIFIVLCSIYLPVHAMNAPSSLSFDVVRYEVTGANPLRPEMVTKVLMPYLEWC